MFGDAEDDNVVVHASSMNVQCSSFNLSVLFNDTGHFLGGERFYNRLNCSTVLAFKCSCGRS